MSANTTARISGSKRWVMPAAVGILGLIIWEAACALFGVPVWIVPAPSDIVSALFESFSIMLPHIGYTVAAAGTGMIAAVVVAIASSLLMEVYPRLKAALYPYIVVSQTIPIIFIYPLLMIWFGFGIATKIIVTVLVCFFPIAVALSDGLGGADRDLVDLFRSMGAGKRQILLKVKIPGAVPSLFSGLKIAATYCVMGAVIGEWLGSRFGMGVFMMRSYKTFDTARVFSAIIVVIALSYGFFSLVSLIERGLGSKYTQKHQRN